MDWLSHLTDAPFANILFLAGLAFLAVGIVGKLILGKSVARIEPDRIGRMISAIVGGVLISAGVYLHANSDGARQQFNNDLNNSKDQDTHKPDAEKKRTNHVVEKLSGAHARSNDQNPVAISPQKNPAGTFEGTWELISSTIDGATQTVKPTRVTIMQDGPLVHIGNQHLQVASNGTATYKEFYAHDPQQGHRVSNDNQADLTDTFTWKVEGSTLVFESVFDYKTANYHHPLGKVVRIMVYRRVSP